MPEATLGCCALLVELAVDVGELLEGATALMLGAGERAASISERRATVSPSSAWHVRPIRPTTSCIWRRCSPRSPTNRPFSSSMTCGFQLALLLAQSVTGELQRGGALHVMRTPGRPIAPGAADSSTARIRVSSVARVEVLVLAGAIDLALKRLELARSRD